ncbi:MAG TPA: cell division protein ZapA [Gammaproteobacteria bacterium]|nr:cell division protein ZapA [Gammaproteobacteria bacterium]
MIKDANAVKIMILDKEYMVSCPDDEKEALDASVRHLTEKMSEIRSTGKVVGIDRIAVMAGLNLAHEAIQSGSAIDSGENSTGPRLRELNTRIEEALASYRQAEMN